MRHIVIVTSIYHHKINGILSSSSHAIYFCGSIGALRKAFYEIAIQA